MQISTWLTADYFTEVNAYQLMPIMGIKIIFWVTIKPLLFCRYGYVTIFYQEKHSCSQEQKWFRQIGLKQRTLWVFRSGRRVHPPETVRTFLSFMVAPIARRESELVLTIWFWNISLSRFISPLLQSSTRRIQVASTCEQAQAGSLMPLASSTERTKQIKMLENVLNFCKDLKEFAWKTSFLKSFVPNRIFFFL